MSRIGTSPVSSRAAFTTAAVADRPRETLGHWELVELVAAGSFAEVYRARPLSGAATTAYALKRVKSTLRDRDRAENLLRREARVGRAISSPHLVPVLDAQLERTPHYLVMPWLEGATLDRLATQSLPLPLLLWLARQVAEALAALDSANWMHADVKPANIMVSPTGHATLLDLGLARRPADEDRAHEQAWIGTPLYMAPEMLLSTTRGDVRSDMYSLGAVLYELLCGQPPFAAAGAGELITAHRQQEATPLRELRADLPKNVADLVHTLLAKQPLRRVQTPPELVRSLMSLEIEYLAEE